MTRAFFAALAAAFFLLLPSSLPGQTPAPAGPGAVIGTGAFTVFVENMDRSLAFYHDVFGMEVPPLPASGERPYNNANPRLFAMFDIQGAKERHQSARVPGTRAGIEVMEIQNVDHKTIDLRIQDPGTATLVLLVRDLDAELARVKQANVAIATPGGKPVAFADGSRAILIRDVDNRFIELRQTASNPDVAAPSSTNIFDMRLSIAVNDMAKTTQRLPRRAGVQGRGRDGLLRRQGHTGAHRPLEGRGPPQPRPGPGLDVVDRVRRVQGRRSRAAPDADPGPRRGAAAGAGAERRRARRRR